MAGIVATSETTHTSLKRIRFTWVSDAAGAADATSTATFDGALVMVSTTPGNGGTQPTDQYDLVIKNSDGIDMMAGQGANRSNVNTEIIASGMGGFSAEAVTLGITNAGNAKAGTVYVWIR